jgi:23S rRNA (adenine2503-C2)-methyltransferase
MENLYNYTLSGLTNKMVELGQKKFRATQLFTWMYEKKVANFEDMTDVAVAFRSELNQKFNLTLPTIASKQVSNDGTVKLLVKLNDGMSVEVVLMRYDYGNSICISTQVGCSMGCAFCASGLMKKQRDCSIADMMGQFMLMQREIGLDDSITHMVLMGSGEPFDNYDNVIGFLKNVNNPKGLAIGARHITVSTCGIADKVRAFADEDLSVNLAISLHAPNNEIRDKIMKINKAFPLTELIDAVKYYESKSSRRVTFEYILLAGINDQDEHAKELASLVRGMNAYVNLIPFNSVFESGFKRSSNNRIHAFADYLKNSGVNSTIRKEFGHDIDAACGQLRAKKAGVI